MKISILACLLPLCLASCSLYGGNKEDPRSRALEVWKSKQIENYSVEIQVGCFCTIAVWTPAKITVTGDSVTSAVRIRDAEPVPVNELTFLPSINKLFDIIQDAENGGADSIETSYHSDLGYPTTITIDYISGAVDDEISYSVSQLIPSE